VLRVKKTVCLVLVPMFLSSLLAGQGVVEAAKQEKARREKLKGKISVVVTNAELSKIKKKAAVTESAPPEGEIRPDDTAGQSGTTEGQAAADKAAEELRKEVRKKFLEKKAELEDRVVKAKEYAELLDLKMKALSQQFYTFNSMASKDQIRQSISETYQTLQSAVADHLRAKDELERFLALAAKDLAAAVGLK
jgi:hypothetical protein